MSLLRAAGAVSVLTLASRILGLVRDVVTYHVFGTSWVSGAFVLAWMVPNLLRRLFGEGALSAAFVPAFARARVQEQGESRARDLLASVSGALITGLAVVCAIVVVVGLVVPPEWWHLESGKGTQTVSSAEVGNLFRHLLAILFPYVLPVCVLAVWTGALNALGVFSPSATAPIVLNLFWLGALGVLHARGTDDLPAAAHFVAWVLLLGGFAQLLLAAIPLRRRGFLPRPRWPRHGDGARAVFIAMLPTAFGMSVVQLNVLLDQSIAAWMIGAEANNYVYLANRLLLFPHALVALPLATVVFPTLALHASQDDHHSLRASLDRALSITMLLAVPAAVGLAAVCDDLLSVAFVHGRYTQADADTTRWTTITLVAGLPAIGSSQLLARALFALGDTKTPARYSAWLVAANVALNLFFVGVLHLGVAGLTAATSICAYGNSIALRIAVARRIGHSPVEGRAIIRTLIASAVMGAAILGLAALHGPGASGTSRLLFGLVIPIVVGIGVWVAVLHLLRSPELRELRARIAARRARRTRRAP
ncbi:MAG: murein biosynthesis integral membrane protein MurJ [Planctomycetota bacterium]